MEAALAYTARVGATEHGVPVGECYAELRSLSQEITARVGRTASRREQHAIMARRYGVDEAEITAQHEVARKRRAASEADPTRRRLPHATGPDAINALR